MGFSYDALQPHLTNAQIIIALGNSMSAHVATAVGVAVLSYLGEVYLKLASMSPPKRMRIWSTADEASDSECSEAMLQHVF